MKLIRRGLLFLLITTFTLTLTFFFKNQDTPTENTTKVIKLDKEQTLNDSDELISNLEPPEHEQPLANPIQTSNLADLPPSRLAAYAGFGHNIEKDEEQFSADEIQRENYIAECMQKIGFTYEPTPSITISEEAIDNTEEFERLLQEAATDPNETYINNLSDDERTHYFMSLYGIEDPNDPEAYAHEYTDNNDSCTSQAFQKIPGVYNKFNALRVEYEQMEEQILEDDRIVELNAAWSECMSYGGQNFQSPSAMAKYIDEKISLTGVSTTDKQIETLIQNSEECKVKSQFAETQALVRIEHENEFVEEHLDRLNQNQ